MSRILCGLLFGLCCSTAWGQVGIYQALPQPPAVSAYPLAFPQQFNQPQFFGGAGPMWNGGFVGNGFGGIGGFGWGGGWGGFGPFGFGARGFYPPNPFGNLNWLPPNPPSPYYVVPSGTQYLEQARRRDQAVYSEIILRHNLGQ